MSCRSKIWGVFFFMIALRWACPAQVFAQDTFEGSLQKRNNLLLASVKEDTGNALLPNDVLQNLTSPSGWGGFGNYIFGGIGGDYPQAYSKHPDMIAFGGFCAGNPQKAVNVAFGLNLADVHKMRDYSGNLVISRQIFTGSSISAGALQLFANAKQSDAPGSTFYFAFSHAVQTLPSATEGSSKLTYTIGIGSGRFYMKSPQDKRTGKGIHGTAVFGGISYELIKNINFNAEWSGMNLGCSFGIKPFESPLAIGIGVTNLTRYTSDRANASFVISYPLSVKR